MVTSALANATALKDMDASVIPPHTNFKIQEALKNGSLKEDNTIIVKEQAFKIGKVDQNNPKHTEVTPTKVPAGLSCGWSGGFQCCDC